VARRKRSPVPPPTTVVLDSEALWSIASPGDRGVAARRASAILTVALASGSRVIVPAPVLAEVGRTATRRLAIDVAVAKLVVVATDRTVAQRAGLLLGQISRGSELAVDAFVAATAAEYRPAVIVTGDSDDLGRLCDLLPDVTVQALAD
jgi:predicted nucleic acid-binding protein